MRRNRPSGKTARIEAAFARGLYHLCFHSSSLKSLEAGNHPVPKEWLTENGKNLGNRFSAFVPDDRIGIKESKSPPSGQFSTNRRLTGPHKPNQNNVSIRVNKIHGTSIV